MGSEMCIRDRDTALQCGLVDRLVRVDANANANANANVDADADAKACIDKDADCVTIDTELHAMLVTLGQHSQFSLRNLKQVLHAVSEGQTTDDVDSVARFVEAFHGEDLAEGMDAFLTRREPRFPYR